MIFITNLILTGAFEIIVLLLNEEVEEVVNDAQKHLRLLRLQGRV